MDRLKELTSKYKALLNKKANQLKFNKLKSKNKKLKREKSLHKGREKIQERCNGTAQLKLKEVQSELNKYTGWDAIFQTVSSCTM